MSEDHAIRVYFLKRLIYLGRVKNSDLQKTFGLSPRTSHRRLLDLRREFSDLIDLSARNVSLASGQIRVAQASLESRAPDCVDLVSGTQILNEFWEPARNDSHFGADAVNAAQYFSEDAVHFMVNHLGASQLPSDVNFSPLIHALVDSTAVSIQYVSMKRGAKSSERTIFPRILRIIGDQFVVSAYDVDDLSEVTGDKQAPLKTFVLFRVLHVRRLRQTAKLQSLASLIDRFPGGRERFRTFKVHLNKDFTRDQKTALRRELGLDEKDQKRMDSALLFQFKAQFMVNRDFSDMHSDSVVWPIVESIEEA